MNAFSAACIICYGGKQGRKNGYHKIGYGDRPGIENCIDGLDPEKMDGEIFAISGNGIIINGKMVDPMVNWYTELDQSYITHPLMVFLSPFGMGRKSESLFKAAW